MPCSLTHRYDGKSCANGCSLSATRSERSRKATRFFAAYRQHNPIIQSRNFRLL